VNTVISSSISAARERMRRHRQRRRDKLRCLLIELRESEIDELIRRGLLPPECGFRRNPAGYSDLMPAGIPI
jgi:hypothetical protein